MSFAWLNPVVGKGLARSNASSEIELRTLVFGDIGTSVWSATTAAEDVKRNRGRWLALCASSIRLERMVN